MERTVVIGLDGADVDKAAEWAPELLLDRHRPLDLEAFPYIWTFYIWPAMYTGRHPRPSREEDDGAGTDWGHPFLQTASRWSQSILPDTIRSKVGSLFERHGIGTRTRPRREEYEHLAIFNEQPSRAIDVPGWNFGELDIAFHDNPPWRVLLDADDGIEQVYSTLDEELQTKAGIVTKAFSKPYDLVWCHVHALDTVQHLFDRDVQETWYARAADWLQDVRSHLDDDDHLVVLSDHGLQDGEHHGPGLVAVGGTAFENRLPGGPTSVYPWLRELLETPRSRTSKRMDRLRHLGYRDVPNIG